MEVRTADNREITVMVGESEGTLIIESGKNIVIMFITSTNGYKIVYKTRITLIDKVFIYKSEAQITAEEHERLMGKMKELRMYIDQGMINLADRLAGNIERTIKELLLKYAPGKFEKEEIPIYI